MGLIFRFVVEVTADQADWDPPEYVPSIFRDVTIKQDGKAPQAVVEEVRRRFAMALDEAINEFLVHP